MLMIQPFQTGFPGPDSRHLMPTHTSGARPPQLVISWLRPRSGPELVSPSVFRGPPEHGRVPRAQVVRSVVDKDQTIGLKEGTALRCLSSERASQTKVESCGQSFQYTLVCRFGNSGTTAIRSVCHFAEVELNRSLGDHFVGPGRSRGQPPSAESRDSAHKRG